MPTYEYACRACGEHLEVVQSFRDDALTECPHCQGDLRKVYSAAGIIFKGSGWHSTDYGPKRTKEDASSSASESSSDEGGSKEGSSSDSGSNGSDTGSGDAGGSEGSSPSKKTGDATSASSGDAGTTKGGSSTNSSDSKSA